MRRNVGVAAVEGKSVDAPVGLKKGDLFGLLTVGNIVNFKSRRLFFFAAIAFQVYQHDIAAHSHLVRVHALRNFNLSNDLRMLGIFNIDDACPMRWVHVTDEGVAVLDYNLPPACDIRASDLPYVFTDSKLGCVAVSMAHKIFSSSSWVGSSIKPKATRSIK